MPPDAAHLLSEALQLVLLLSLPPVLAAWTAGGLVSALATRLGAADPVLSAVPRAAAALLGVFLAGPWIVEHAVRFGRAALAAAVGLPE